MSDAVVAEGLTKRYGSVVALDGVDLRVPTATVLGLLGPNGAGKTTAVRILTTIIRPDDGNAQVHLPPVLFLDEPTTGLDPRGRLDLWDVIRGLVADGTTVLLTTQYLEEADRLAHRIVVIDQGRVIAEGTPAELKARLGSTVIEIGLADETAALLARAVLARLDGVPEIDGRTVRLSIHDGPAASATPCAPSPPRALSPVPSPSGNPRR